MTPVLLQKPFGWLEILCRFYEAQRHELEHCGSVRTAQLMAMTSHNEEHRVFSFLMCLNVVRRDHLISHWVRSWVLLHPHTDHLEL